MTKINIPVLISDNDGNPKMEIGSGDISENSLTINFADNNIMAMAIQRILKRGESLGLVFIKFEDEEETNNQEKN